MISFKLSLIFVHRLHLSKQRLLTIVHFASSSSITRTTVLYLLLLWHADLSFHLYKWYLHTHWITLDELVSYIIWHPPWICEHFRAFSLASYAIDPCIHWLNHSADFHRHIGTKVRTEPRFLPALIAWWKGEHLQQHLCSWVGTGAPTIWWTTSICLAALTFRGHLLKLLSLRDITSRMSLMRTSGGVSHAPQHLGAKMGWTSMFVWHVVAQVSLT